MDLDPLLSLSGAWALTVRLANGAPSGNKERETVSGYMSSILLPIVKNLNTQLKAVDALPD
jgi:hypothetical protein